MYIRNTPFYSSFEQVWKEGYISPYFQSKIDKDSEKVDMALSERQLFVQSNGRAMLGQDTRGRLHFICSPHEQTYAIPSGGPNVGGQFHGHIGQFYQIDVALLLGKMRYEIELDNGLLLNAAGEDATTVYLDHFLPLTISRRQNMETHIFSLAPIPEKESIKVSDIHPLPGPCGVLFGVEVKNTGKVPIRGKIHLRMEERLFNQFEQYGERFEDYANAPYKTEWDNKLLVLWHPEACATIQFLGAKTAGNPENPKMYHTFEIAPGKSQIFITLISITPQRSETYEALGVLYRHTALEWINITKAYWEERFGKLKMVMNGDVQIGQKYRDMHIRFILDNFNCLQFDRKGHMLTCWQGAPSHALGRSWGIDIEPNVFGVLWAIPEIGRSATIFASKFNMPDYSIYDDHSMLIALSPITIAGKYLSLTGDSDFFASNQKLMDRLHDLYQYMLAHKHPQKALFSSRYGSDLCVFKKYDYGTNVKCIYALTCYADILSALGIDDSEPRKLATQSKHDLCECMEAEGPFGRQITGGTNLGENDGFYVQDDLYYYGGEDTATSLAPLYGLYEFDYEPYVNLNLYARSLFITNYDPEYETLRELHYGMNPSATGVILRLGGSRTKNEMKRSLKILFDRLDESGSLFWWPRASNKKRCLTRCSQGQGAWLQQSEEQWLGLRMDGTRKILTIRPQGLLSDYEIIQSRIGNYTFDVQWHESKDESVFYAKNRNEVPFTIRFGARLWGAGTQGKLTWFECVLAPGETVKHTFSTAILPLEIEKSVCNKEVELLANDDGVIFGPYGIVLPKLYNQKCEVFLLRYAIVNGTKDKWENIDVHLRVPTGWFTAEKGYFIWDYMPEFDGNTATIHFAEIKPSRHYVAPFFVAMPICMAGGEKSVMLSKHPFQMPSNNPTHPILLVEADGSDIADYVIEADLFKNGKKIICNNLPVKTLNAEMYEKQFDLMLHGN